MQKEERRNPYTKEQRASKVPRRGSKGEDVAWVQKAQLAKETRLQSAGQEEAHAGNQWGMTLFLVNMHSQASDINEDLVSESGSWV